jgi:hypothetical protein
MAMEATEPIRPVDILDGGRRRRAIQDWECSTCGGPATAFRDARERSEYAISGMCSPCQSAFFPVISQEFIIETNEATVTIAVDLQRDGAAVIEAFACEDDAIYDIGIWSVDAQARAGVASLVIAAVTAWCTEYKVVLDDGVTDSALVFSDLRACLSAGALTA